MIRIAALATASVLIYSPPAFAWGGLAHEAVCELAFLELDDTARQRVIALIQQDQQFTTFRASCNWPDRPRQRAEERFVNFPRDACRHRRRRVPHGGEVRSDGDPEGCRRAGIARMQPTREASCAQVPRLLLRKVGDRLQRTA